MKVHKLEILGIAVSIGAMAIALWLLRINDATVSLPPDIEQSQPAVVFVAEDKNSNAGIADAIIEASRPDGTLERLIVDDIEVGNGEEARIGQTVSVHYMGSFQDGKQFDNSYERGEPFSFTIGDGKVIEGWEQGIIGMRVGGKRILVVPSDMAYGENGYGPIPGDTSLVFAIELLEIQ